MFEHKATLRVKSNTLSFDEICKHLGQPTHGFTKGQEYGKAKKLRGHSLWGLVADEDSDLPLQNHIINLAEFLSNSDVSEIKKECEIDIFCFLSSDNGQGSFTLNDDLLKGSFMDELSITFDFYADVDD